MEPLDHMDTTSFKMAFERFQANRGECAYLRSDAGSNFIGARNQDIEILEDVINEVQAAWHQQNKIWDINPPHASHMGGAWKRAIGQVRQVIQGYLLPKDERNLTREEFDTMIRHCAAIVNSTPFFDPPESPNEPQPITPQQLITQRDEACREKYSRPTIYSNDDILAYGANRWKRTQALADEFWQYWQPYIYNIGTDRPK